jgi:hypothetical protein
VFLSLTNTTGAKNKQISQTLPHRTPCALCGSVKKNTDSLVKVKGMILFDQGGGEGGGKRSCSKVLPPVSPWSACFRLFPLVSACFHLFPLVFCCCLRERLQRIFSDIFPGSKILARNSPAGPPNLVLVRFGGVSK